MKEWIRRDCGGTDDIAAAFAELRALFACASGGDDPVRRAGKMTDAEREAWTCLQAYAAPGSVADADIACLLASADVNYSDNLHRLLRSRTIECEAHVRDTPMTVPVDNSLCRISEHAARLYDSRRDPDVLGWLLDQEPRGEDEQNARDDALIDLWDRHWSALLRTSSGRRGRCRRISDALSAALGIAPHASVWHGYLRHLRACVTGRDPAMRSAALDVLRLLRQRHRPFRAGRGSLDSAHGEQRRRRAL